MSLSPRSTLLSATSFEFCDEISSMSETKSGENKPVKIPPGPKQWPDYLPGNPTKTSRIGEDPVLEPPLPKVRDVYGRIVSTKKANQPFLA